MANGGGLKQFRAVYTYRRNLLRGAGACFVIATDEAAALQQISEAMPGVEVTQIREEPEDVLAVYERKPLKLVRPEAGGAE